MQDRYEQSWKLLPNNRNCNRGKLSCSWIKNWVSLYTHLPKLSINIIYSRLIQKSGPTGSGPLNRDPRCVLRKSLAPLFCCLQGGYIWPQSPHLIPTPHSSPPVPGLHCLHHVWPGASPRDSRDLRPAAAPNLGSMWMLISGPELSAPQACQPKLASHPPHPHLWPGHPSHLQPSPASNSDRPRPSSVGLIFSGPLKQNQSGIHYTCGQT